MSKTAFGSISGVPWSTTPESAYTVIVDGVTMGNKSEPKTLEDEVGAIKLHVQDGDYTEVSMEATIKGATHFGARALVGSVISSLSDPDIPTPLIVTDNEQAKKKRDWHTCKLTARYYGATFTTGQLSGNLGTTTTTTTTTGA